MKLSIILFYFFLYLSPCWAIDLAIEIKNIQSKQGEMMISICTDKTQYDSKICSHKKKTDINMLANPVIFKDIDGINLAIIVFQDLNENGVLDKSFFGTPNEPIGFSNNPKLKFGPPTYEQVVFQANENLSTPITINLMNSKD